MEDSGAILCQISSFKDMLDKVNEEIEQTIHRTREIDSEIVKCSEIEKGHLLRELEMAKIVSVAEFELNGLTQVAANGNNSLELLNSELRVVERNLDDTKKRISAKREKFIVLCSLFQRDIVKGENEELTLLISEKEELENEKKNLHMKINALQNSTEEFLEEFLEEICSSNSALEAEVQRLMSEKRELLNDISEMKILLQSIWLSENSS